MRLRLAKGVTLLHLGIVTTLFLMQFILPPFHATMLTRIMVLSTYAIGYNVLLGYTGLMSLGHAMFFSTGLYTVGLTMRYLHLEPFESLGLALLTSLLISILIGFIALRTRAIFFLITTLIFGQVFYLTTIYFNPITFGEQGFMLAGIQQLRLGGLVIDMTDGTAKYNLALLLFTTGLFSILWLSRSTIGRVLVAIKENEERAEMIGYNVFRYKLLAFTLSGTISGISGAFYAILFAYIGSVFASILFSIDPLLWTLVGGAGTTIGPFVGTLIMTYIVDITSAITPSYLLVVGAALLILALVSPMGIMGTVKRRWFRWLP